MNILEEILTRRLDRIHAEGAELGHLVPLGRQAPLNRFLRSPEVICEIKKRSPSRGDIDAGLNVVVQAEHYYKSGVRTVSVLTEEDRFGGSLADLMAVKKAFPDLAVLRKDFLALPEDIEVSFRAGADAVLLIAGMLEDDALNALYLQARGLGMAVLVEVHSEADVEKARRFKPRFTGINCRDLVTFQIDPALPLKIKNHIDWHTRVVFESGIFSASQANWTSASGFHGVLVGEGAVRDPKLAGSLTREYLPAGLPGFWGRLFARKREKFPLVKICGLTRSEDVFLADGLGADMVGFILTESPRRVTASWVRGLPGTRALKVGVVRLGKEGPVPGEISDLLAEGSLDALQFHGEEAVGLLEQWMNYGYKTISPKNTEEVKQWDGVWPPRILLDAFVPGQAGGTGKLIQKELLQELAGRPLWLAGGLNPGNVGAIISDFKPELIDVSSGLESLPGVKDHDKMHRYFEEIQHAVG